MAIHNFVPYQLFLTFEKGISREWGIYKSKLNQLRQWMGTWEKEVICLYFVWIQAQSLLRFLLNLSLLQFCKVIPGVTTLCAFLFVANFWLLCSLYLEIYLSVFISQYRKTSMPFIFWISYIRFIETTNYNEDLVCAEYHGEC